MVLHHFEGDGLVDSVEPVHWYAPQRTMPSSVFVTNVTVEGFIPDILISLPRIRQHERLGCCRRYNLPKFRGNRSTNA